MGLRFSRRVSIFPGVRLNFSGSGVSTTIGVRGASVTLGGRYGATANLGIPGSGLALRIPLKSSEPKTPSPVGPNPIADAVIQGTLYPNGPAPEVQQPAPPAMTPVQSDAVGNITTPGLTKLRELIVSAAEQRRTAEATVSKAANLLSQWEQALADVQMRRNRAEQRHAKLAASIFRRFRKGAIAAAQVEVEQQTKEAERATSYLREAHVYKEATEARRDELWVDTDLDLSGPAFASWNRLVEAFNGLSRSEGIWDITAYRAKRAGVERSAATKIVDRKSIQLATSELSIIQTKYDALRWRNSNGGDLFIYPGFLIVFQDEQDFAMLGLNEVQCHFEPRRYEEWEKAPQDSKQVGIAWRYSNRDGSPDRRYSDNSQTPVFLYAEVAWRSATGLSEEYLFSNAEAAAKFADAFAEFRSALDGTSPRNAKQQSGVGIDDAIKRVLDRVEIHPTDYEQVPGTTKWNFNCDFHCRACGGTVLSVPDNATDDSIASCKACGAEIGKYGDVKAAGRLVGQEELHRRGLA
jgi:hypothetical protein